MKPQLNHAIVLTHDREESALFACEILGFDPQQEFSTFLVVETGNGVSLDFLETEGEISSQHFAFLVTEANFDVILARIMDREIPYWADPSLSRAGAINHNDGGRGVYFADPGGHLLEIITRPYGSGPSLD